MSNKLTFNGALDEMTANQVSSEAIRFMERLRDIYAPTIEMTKNQYLFINSEYEKESIVDAVANLTADDIIKEKFHSNFWSPLTQEQVVQAWLPPDTIKMVE